MIFISIMLIFTSISSSIGLKINEITYEINILNRDILYVGGSGPNNYTSIQYAIDDASDGDIVFVFEGIYDEIIQVNKTISLVGEEKSSTIINGSKIGTIVTINADYVNISKFTIKNSNSNKYGIDVKSDKCNISNNIFSDNGYGLYIINSDMNIITKNTFIKHKNTCLQIEHSNNNTISENHFSDEPPGSAINIINSNFSIISDNHIAHTVNGIYISHCNNLIIFNNNLIQKTYDIALWLYYTDNCTIVNNNIYSWAYGLYLWNSNNNNFMNNEISDCYYHGVFFYSKSNYNNISNNFILDNDGGITIWDFNSNNTIFYNTINSNKYGINIKYQSYSNDNIIYHNNLIDNNVNALDGCANIWNDSYPSGGNYWSEYVGEDDDGDGIGDTALNIYGGGGNKDYYPLMYPWGEQRPVANYTYFEEYGGYVFNALSSYDRDGEIVSYEWDFADGTTDSGMVVAHSYNSSGQFDVLLTVTDDEGYRGNLTKTIDADRNYPPEIPSIDGPSSGKWGKPYYFTFQTTDVEGSDIWYFVDWGDGSDTGWMGPFISGDEVSEPHTWIDQETYVVRCKAKDMYGIQSDWAEHEITIPRTRASSYLLYEWLLERFPMLERFLALIR